MQSHSDLSSGFTGGGATASGSVANVDLLAGTLAVKRFCHGLIKISLYPDQYNKRGREALAGYRRAARMSDAEAHQLKLSRIDREYRKAMESRDFKHGSALSVAKKFNGDMKLAAGKKYRRKTFTYTGAITVNEVGQIAEEKYGKSGIFLTGTIPGTGDHINDVIADYSGYIVNRVREWFRKWFASEYTLINVWEFQTLKRKMLHIHIAIFSHEKQVLQKIVDEWKARWNKLLMDVSKKSGVDVFRRDENKTWRNDLRNTHHDAQWVKFSVSRYLAKYLSKTARQDATHSAAHPSRWWGVDARTRAEAHQRRLSLRVSVENLRVGKEVLEMLIGALPTELEGLVMKQHEKIPSITFGGKFFEPEKSEEIWAEMFAQLSTRFGDQCVAVFAE